MNDVIDIHFEPVWAAYEGCLARLVGYLCYSPDINRRWFAPLRNGSWNLMPPANRRLC